jgi:HepT-like protein
LRDSELGESEPQEKLIVFGYRLHSLYNAFENIFRNVAVAFENSLDDRTGWHHQLLQRMRDRSWLASRGAPLVLLVGYEPCRGPPASSSRAPEAGRGQSASATTRPSRRALRR